MRFIETAELNDLINKSLKLNKRRSVAALFSDIEDMELISLQNASLDHDVEFLRAVTSLLNVIVSIIYHPHISNKTEEVVLRVEKVGSLGNDEFRQILTDSKLWRRHGAEMIPEEVHYKQYIDEMCIYENKFICLLIDMVDRELTKYSTFYVSKLPTYDSRSASLPKNEVGDLIITVDRLKRKIRFIKETFFYKTVSREKPISGRIKPTNILTKDRLYCHCYRFYRRFVCYEDVEAIKTDLMIYYVLLILKAVKKRGFELAPGTNMNDDVLKLVGAHFSLELEIVANGAISMTVMPKGTAPARHLLRFSIDDVEENREAVSGSYDSEESMSLWGLTALDAASVRVCASEKNLVRSWLESKLRLAKLEHRIYSIYCPVCRARAVAEEKGIYTCNECGSQYVFLDPKGDDVWFRKIRK